MGGSDSKEEVVEEDPLQKNRSWTQDADWQRRYKQQGKGPGVVGGLPAMAGKRFTDPHNEPFVVIPSRYPADWYPPGTGEDANANGKGAGAPNQNGKGGTAGAKDGTAGQGLPDPSFAVASRAGYGTYPAPPGHSRENWMQNDPRVQNFYQSNGRMVNSGTFAGPAPLRGTNPSNEHYGDYYLTKAPGIDK